MRGWLGSVLCVEVLAWSRLSQVSSHLLGSAALRDRILDLPAALLPVVSGVIRVGRVVRSISQLDYRGPSA